MEPPCVPKPCQSSDRSDKSLKLLMESLSKLPKSPNVTKETSSPSSSKDSRRTSTRKRTLKCDKDYPKITNWVQKKPKRDETSHYKSLDVTINSEKGEFSKGDKPKTTKKSKDKSRSLKRTPSFEKYGIVLPSFEKIVADQKKFDEHKQAVLKLDALVDNLFEEAPATDCLQEPEEFSEELLDCKHLSLQDLDRAFGKHLKSLTAIKSGEKHSRRHATFSKNPVHGTPSHDLRCSASLMVFTQDQKDHLLDLLRVELDPDEKCTGYFFKVLLPELCLRIFKDEHKMSKRAAGEYLDRRPLDSL